MQLYDEQIKTELKERVEKLEEHFKADVAFYYGPMYPAMQKLFRDFIEKLKDTSIGTIIWRFFSTLPEGVSRRSRSL